MNIFENIKKIKCTNAHGEINFFKIEDGFVDDSEFTTFKDANSNGDVIVGHSESGHNHVLERTKGMTIKEMEHKGSQMLYAVLNNPAKLYQEAGSPHKQQTVEAGKYIIGSSLDYDPFTQQAKRVAD